MAAKIYNSLIIIGKLRDDDLPQPGICSWRFVRFSLVAAIIASTMPCSAAMVDEAWLARLQDEAIKSWRQAEQATQTLCVSFEHTSAEKYPGPGGKLVAGELEETFNWCWDAVNRRRMFELETLDGAGTPIVVRRVVNPDYRFFVGHESDSAQWKNGDQWKLHSGDKPAGGEDFGRFSAFESTYQWYVQSSFRVHGVPLWELLEGDEMRLETVTPVADGRRIRIAAGYLGEKASFRPKGATFWAEVDPNNSWFIATGGMDIAATGEEDVQEVSYQNVAPLQLPFPKILNMRHSDPSAQVELVQKVVFGVPHQFDLADDEFRLAYYGIDENALTTTSTGSAGRLAVMATCLAALIGFYLILKRRKDAASE